MKKLSFLWFIPINTYPRFGVITTDPTTLHGNFRFNSSLPNVESKLNGITLSFYINDYHLSSLNIY